MTTVWQDVRFALRLMRKNLPVTLLATGSLALAVAGNTTVYSLVNSFLNRPLPYRDVERLEFVGERASGRATGQISTVSAGNYLDIAQRQRSFREMAAYRGRSFTLRTEGRPVPLSVGEVTPGFFRVLGTGPVRGRAFTEEEGTPGRDRVAVVSDRFWREHFGGRPSLEGATLAFGGAVYDVVGVMDPKFEWFVAPKTDVWAPLALDLAHADRQTRSLLAVGRLAPGVTEKAAAEDVAGVMAQLVKEHPDANRGRAAQLLNMRHDVPDPQVRLFLHLTQGALLFVLLIACANVANLLLSRSQAREREIVLRSALGARRGRVMAQLLTESLVMAAIAGAVGIALGWAAIRVVSASTASFLPALWVPSLDVRVLLYSVAITAAAGLLFGLAPVVQTSRFDLVTVLKSAGRGAAGGGKQRRRVSNALVIAEIALALVFLAGASVMIGTFRSMQNADPGFATARTLIARVELPGDAYATPEQRAEGVRQLRERLAALPGVRGATVSTVPPRTLSVGQTAFEVTGQPPARDDALPRAGSISAGPQYFETLGLRMQSGRAFTPDDQLGHPPVVIVNRLLARRYFGGADPVGRTLTVDGTVRQIVGVVADARHDLIAQSGGSPQIYTPWAQAPTQSFWVILTSAVEPAGLTEPLRRAAEAMSPDISVTQTQTLDAYVARLWVGQKVFTTILSAFGVLALLLAALGTYGVLAYAVAQRTQEIGIRMALGARPGTVTKMFVRQGLVLGLLGIAAGIPLVLLEIKAIGAVFAGAVSVDPTSAVGVALMMTLVALLASAVPSRRAARISPMEAMRAE